MIRIIDITSQLINNDPKADISQVEKAYVYSAKVHQGQVRLSGLPYLSHPLEVAYQLAKMKMDVTCVIVGLLHDTLEDTTAELPEIERLFGKDVALIVDGVTKITRMQFTSREERQAENMRKMILAMAKDIRVIIVKLADRLHNMQTLGYQPLDKQGFIANETLNIYAPLAGRMGIHWLKSTLEDLCLFYLEPEIYEKIKIGIAQRRESRERFINEVKELLSEALERAEIKATVRGRHKHFYSVYSKMREQGLSVDQIYDVLAFRVIVNSLKECYEVLGLIHSMWKPVSGRFKDYISMPKANMYQSLHTTVMGPLGQSMEVQIRTWEMDRVAEEGIAAHWKYKEGGLIKKTDEKQFHWLRQLLEWQKNLEDPKEFIESVQMDLFPDSVYVFTPKGEVKEFPRGSTPIDFAYGIHSEVGEKCSGAKVNNKIVPLRYQLRTGDIVEIITLSKQHPRKDWLDFVRTSKAKTKIRQWIKNQERDESLNLGRSLLEKELDQAGISIKNLLKSKQLEAVAPEFSLNSVEDLLANIGYGKLSSRQVIGKLKSQMGLEDQGPEEAIGKISARVGRKKSTRGIKVRGLEDILIRFAKCCHPLPGEHVLGFITQGKGVTIHKGDCRHIIDADPQRVLDVVWEPVGTEAYQAILKVISLDKKGILADISSIISQKDANIIQAEVKTTVDKKGVSFFTLEVNDYNHLLQIMGAIKKVRNVLLVDRI